MMTVGQGARGSAGGAGRHIPVLLHEVLSALNPTKGELYIDGTFGAGGYSKAVLETPGTKVLAIDRDPDAIETSQFIRKEFPARLTFCHGPFADMSQLAKAQSVETVDGVMLDLGVSSMQIDDADRGFSFMQDGPLDMRMAQEGISAADVVNKFEEKQLADILYLLGEEKRSRAIAKAVVAAREIAPITTTQALADIVVSVIGRKPDQKIHPATRSFQALRLYVNEELQQLAEGLRAAEGLLSSGGRLVIVTFHSLEDRIVKRFLQSRSGNTPNPSRHLPDKGDSGPEPSFTLPHRRPIAPSAEELESNPRARSAKLRLAIRTSSPPFPASYGDVGLPQLP